MNEHIKNHVIATLDYQGYLEALDDIKLSVSPGLKGDLTVELMAGLLEEIGWFKVADRFREVMGL